MTSKQCQLSKRDAIVGIDPLLNAYFITLVENGQEIGNPLLFSFYGEDDSPSALAQARRVSHFKTLWIDEIKTPEEITHLYQSVNHAPRLS
ncbi:hypothetical protein ACF3NA_05495 [Alkanindiges sp. WGS2144]|uniref:hypothetical protein n=1 Tax=Alkanindiges sp. WGS2144 TaxID=3366808 RepID=UPI003752DA43